jgi:hypothetical protein
LPLIEWASEGNRMRYLKLVGMLFVVMVLSVALNGCSGNGTAEAGSGLAMAPLSAMPADIRRAPPVVRESYQFAIANPDIVQEIPCYCGCGEMGHTSSYNCYAEGTEDDGNLRFDGHALGCTICVDITQDTMRLLQEGRSVDEIRAYVDQRYSKYGPPTP